MAVAVACLFAGCVVQSVNPYYTTDSVCTVPGIGGEWTALDDQGKPESPRPWIIGPDKIFTFNKNGAPGTLKAVYFRIGETLFLDTTAEGPTQQMSAWWTMHVYPVHVVSRIDVKGDRLTLTPVDYNWIEKALKDGRVKLPHLRQRGEDSLLFTASPEAWMDFLKKYARDGNVFSEKNALHLVRSKDSQDKAQ